MRYWREGISVLATLLLFVPFVLFSNTFQTCINGIPTYEAYQQAPKGLSYFLFSLLTKFGCTGPFIDLNANGIIAVFTVVLTISTVAMWWETRKLASGAEDQARDMKASIAAADTSAHAAVAAQRPWIEIKVAPRSDLVINEHGAMITVICITKNHGKSPALRLMGQIHMTASVYGSHDMRDAVKAIKEGLARLRDDPEIGEPHFPGEVSTDEWRAAVQIDKIKSAVARTGATEFGLVLGVTYEFVGGTGLTIVPVTIFIPQSGSALSQRLDGSPVVIPSNVLQLRPLSIWGTTH